MLLFVNIQIVVLQTNNLPLHRMLTLLKCISIHSVLLLTTTIIGVIIKRKWFSQEKNVRNSRKYNSPTICEKNTKVKPGIREVSSISRKEKNDQEASSWLGSITKHLPGIRKTAGDSATQKGPAQQKETNDTKMMSWFFSSKSTPSTNNTKKVDKAEKKNHKTSEVDLMRRMCGEFRQVIGQIVKLDPIPKSKHIEFGKS